MLNRFRSINVGILMLLLCLSLSGFKVDLFRSDKHKEFLLHYKKVIIALDPDALKKHLQIAKELRNWVAEVKVLRLTDDLKYRKTIDINKLQELVWN